MMYGYSMDGQWSLREDGGYTRPCGCLEELMYWDWVQNGAADLLENVVVDVRPDVPVESIFNKQNVERAWSHVKRLYPLLGARAEEHDDLVRFVVFEKDLCSVGPGEVTFGRVSSDEQASSTVLAMANAKKGLSPRPFSCIQILTRSDRPQRVHVIIQLAHCISDATAQATVQNTLLASLLRNRAPTDAYSLVDRLALSLPSDILKPALPSNSPRQRWRRAIAAVMMQKHSFSGGHTLPMKLTTATPFSTPVSDSMFIALPTDLSAKILAGCKRIGVTFGSALPVLGQIAVTRILFRHYMAGKITQDEWEFRKREPMHTNGPMNTRSLMDQKWYKDGGKDHLCINVAFYALTLPFMPLGNLTNAKPFSLTQTPPFSAFISTERFSLRCRMVQKRLRDFIEHPLFLEKVETWLSGTAIRTRARASQWRENEELPADSRVVGDDISAMELTQAGPVFTHSGSSFGKTDHLYPLAYPLELEEGERPIFTLDRHASGTHMHCRPAAFYLGARSVQGKLNLCCFWDADVYESDTVKEFLQEAARAAEWYLAHDQARSHQTLARL